MDFEGLHFGPCHFNYRPVVTCLRKMPAKLVVYTGVMFLAKSLRSKNGDSIHHAMHHGCHKRVQWVLVGLFQSCATEPPMPDQRITGFVLQTSAINSSNTGLRTIWSIPGVHEVVLRGLKEKPRMSLPKLGPTPMVIYIWESVPFRRHQQPTTPFAFSDGLCSKIHLPLCLLPRRTRWFSWSLTGGLRTAKAGTRTSSSL